MQNPISEFPRELRDAMDKDVREEWLKAQNRATFQNPIEKTIIYLLTQEEMCQNAIDTYIDPDMPQVYEYHQNLKDTQKQLRSILG